MIKPNSNPRTANPQSKQGQDVNNLWEDSYPWSKCIWQVSFLSFTLILWGKLVLETLAYHSSPLCTVLGFIFAQYLVDFISGLMHWGADTWGHFDTPILGPTVIRSFRMHHVDPQDICKHGFIQTNASTSYPMPPWILIGIYFASSSYFSQFYNWTIIFGVPLGIMTNEIHKWAHMVDTQPNFAIKFLQKSGLIISHDRHHIHHTNQFDNSYCIINGWMNPILEKMDFWRRFENLITKVTGAEPRSDDNYWRLLKEK